MRKRKNNNYSKALKEKAVEMYLNGDKSSQKICDELGIADRRTLRDWVGKIQRGESLDDGRGKHDSPRRGRPRTKFSSIEEELAYVKAERDYLKKLYRSRFGKEWGAED